MLAAHFNEPEDVAMTKVEEFEKEVKRQFVEEPGRMRLLIVVDKLLTGFDAPSATYLYIDKKMRDHGLFQAICRVNRLDGDDKQYGYIVDYRDLFNSLQDAVTDYTAGMFDAYEREDIEGLLSNRIDKGRKDLNDALERIRALCEPVAPPRGTLQYQQYFCAAEQGNAAQLKANEPKRVELYKAVAAVTRAFANLANDMEAAKYSPQAAEDIRKEVRHYVDVRAEVKLGAGEDVDFKQYEAGMRFLLDTYIQADASRTVSDFEDAGLIQLIVELGAGAVDRLPTGIKSNPEAVAATITNNMRKVIVDERATNPKYFDEMSQLLDAIIEERRKGAIEYEEYLAKLLETAADLGSRNSGDAERYPKWADNGARRALCDFFRDDQQLAIQVDTTVLHNKPHNWAGSPMREKKLRIAVKRALPDDFDRLDELFELVKARHEYH
jgi:type I restriction enzyme R subunit